MNKARRRSMVIPIQGGATPFMNKSTPVSTPKFQTLWVYTGEGIVHTSDIETVGKVANNIFYSAEGLEAY